MTRYKKTISPKQSDKDFELVIESPGIRQRWRIVNEAPDSIGNIQSASDVDDEVFEWMLDVAEEMTNFDKKHLDTMSLQTVIEDICHPALRVLSGDIPDSLDEIPESSGEEIEPLTDTFSEVF